ncbi:VCBS repeat-containing protein [Streptomyces sp. SID4926]|nr:VCBS repeat-containing protein [Streptomyces sp. SID4926]
MALSALVMVALTGGCSSGGDYDAVKHPCASADGTVLHADIDGDGRADTVTDSGRDSHEVRVTFGGGKTLAPNDLAPKGEEIGSASTFGDFDGDGHIDMALVAGAQDDSDDPLERTGRVQQIRFGPLHHDLSGEATERIRFREDLFNEGLRASDTNHDKTAELSVFQTGGDGQVNRLPVRMSDRTPTAGEQPLSEGYDKAHWFKRYEPGWADFGTCGGD